MPSQMSPEIMQAMARRQQGQPPTPALNQMTPGAAGAPQMPAPMPQSQMTQASAPQGTPTGEAPAAPKFQPQDRTDLITVALIEQMKNDQKLQKEQSQMPAQPGPDMGGGGTAPSGIMTTGGHGSPMNANGMQHMMANTGRMPMGGGFSMSPGYEQPMPISAMQGNYAGGMGKDYSGLNGYGTGNMGGGDPRMGC